MTLNQPMAVVAYYLGQFHPTPENDRFWGPGFTEWHNVAKARRLYPGHQQPKLPGRLGFYDLRCEETLAEQIAFSHRLGIHAFCHWHYWFAGKRVLHAPLDTMLSLHYPKFQFMLGWANESWSGIWHGAPRRILIEQTYDQNELLEHAQLISRYIESGCYLWVDGRAPFVVYKPRLVPNALKYLTELKNLVYRFTRRELYVIGNWTWTSSGSFSDPSAYGLDAAVITPLPTLRRNPVAKVAYNLFREAARRVGLGPEFQKYARIIPTLSAAREQIRGTSHASIVTGWDNTPRSGRRGLVVTGYTEKNLRTAAQEAVRLELKNTSPLLFIKSWNEWAEGNMLEPVFGETWSPAKVIQDALAGPQRHSAADALHEVQHVG